MKKIKIILCIMMLATLVACSGEKAELEDASGNKGTNVNTEISMGEWNDNVYKNNFLGLEFTLPEGWTYASNEEIAEIMGLGADIAFNNDEDMAELVNLTSIYYVFATDPNSGNSVSVFTEKPLADVTMDYYMEQVKTQLEAVTEINYEIGEAATTVLDGREFSTLEVTAPDYGFTQKYYMYKMDEYFMGIIVTASQEEDITDTIMENFTYSEGK